MANTKTLTINVDVNSAQKSMEELDNRMKGLEILADRISTAISESFSSAFDAAMTAWNADGIVGELERIRLGVEQLVVLGNSGGGGWFDGILSAFGSLQSVISILGVLIPEEMTTIGGSLAEMFTLSPEAITDIAAVGGKAIAIVALVVAAAGLIITNWDGIVAFLTDTVPEAVEITRVAFGDMCDFISQSWADHSGGLLQSFTDFKGGLLETWWYIYDNIIAPVITNCSELFAWLWYEHLKPLWDNIVGFVASVGENLLVIWNKALRPVIDWIARLLAPAVTTVINAIRDEVGIAVAFISDIIGSVLEMLDGIIQFITGIFTGDWERAWRGVVKIFESLFDGIAGIVKGVINAVILAINVMIGAIYSGIAGVVNGLGGVVKTVGKIFGQSWGFSIPANPPKIPCLAQGAVIPPNAPFMAVLGDQKYGTNIEAPLETIQEAVAAVTGEQTRAILTGFEASVGVQREILEAVLGIQIGDDVIGRAAARYQRKMAVVRGGVL